MKRFSDGVILILALLLLPQALELVFPFIMGFLIYLLCRRPVRRMARAGFNRSLAAVLTLTFALALIVGVLALFLVAAYGERGRLPDLFSRISVMGTSSPLIKDLLEALRAQLSESVQAISMGIISKLGNLTKTLMSLLFALLSAFFFLRDEEKLVDIIIQNGGEGFLKNVETVKRTAGNALCGYIRAQAILMVITFGILTIFLTLFGVEWAMLIALGTAFLDAIPVFGTGFVLLPWAVWEFLTGGAALGFGLLALYGVCSLTRQILEPKILSAHIGLHPLLTLVGIFVGFQLFGVPGLIVGPIAVLIIVTYAQKTH